MTADPAEPPITVSSPADLLAAVPYLLGFHPADSLVVVTLDGDELAFVARADLPPPEDAAGLAGYVAAVVAEQGGDAAALVGYGPAEAVDDVLLPVRDALAGHGLHVVEALRAHGGRFWSYLCAEPDCCPPEGRPYDPASSAVAAAATYAGHTALPSRAALAERIAPVTGAVRESMRHATARARERLSRMLAEAPAADLLGGRAVRRSGERAVAALHDGPPGRHPTDDQVAWLTVLLEHVPVRDAAWRGITGTEGELALWSDVTRRAEPGLVAAPASLLAFGAWLAGQGALANMALDRALAERPDYGLARLLRDALDRGVPPSVLDGWSTPIRSISR